MGDGKCPDIYECRMGLRLSTGVEKAMTRFWRKRFELLQKAAQETIARADDYGDSYITRPIRDAVRSEKDPAK